MKILWHSDIIKHWDDLSWVEAWASVGEIRALCETHIGTEFKRWNFINLHGDPTRALPHGIVFQYDEDATRIKLMI